MFGFERLALGYFVALALAAFLTRSNTRGLRTTLLVSLGSAAAVVVAARSLGDDARRWLGHAYLAAGYWAPALLASPDYPRRFESWLVSLDSEWRRRLPTPPRWMERPAALSYFLCYPLVPAGFVMVWVVDAGSIDRYWVSVLSAGLGCYVWLPWLPSRPPRTLGDRTRPAGVDRLNLLLLDRLSHGWNTFPSGHAAVALAIALHLLPLTWPAGVAFGVLAAGISVGAVTGRHHYVPDVVGGLALGAAAVGVSALMPTLM
jgi:membrane-associated phospholipid phosphatase